MKYLTKPEKLVSKPQTNHSFLNHVFTISINVIIVFSFLISTATNSYARVKTKKYDDGTYVGEFKNNKKNGQGTFTYFGGGKYVGEFKNGKMHGKGTFTFPNGTKYVGTWKDNHMHDKGTFTYSDGSKHVGTYKESEMHGKGTFTYSDGAKYVGTWKDDKMHGQGTLISPDGAKYVGGFKDEKEHEKGIITYPDGTKYSGNLRFKAQIITVTKDSNAEQAGLLQGDIIVEYNGIKVVNGFTELVSLIKATPLQSPVEVKVIRNGLEKDFVLKERIGRFDVELQGYPRFKIAKKIGAVAVASHDYDEGFHLQDIPESVVLGNYNALVIGVNKYKHLPGLKTAENDAKDVARVLKMNYGFNIKLLLNPTRAQIISALRNYRRELSLKDNLLIYYAGHGWLDHDADEGYWLPTDATEQDESNWVSIAAITSAVRAVDAKHVMVVADSCYSGKLVRGLHIKLKKPGYLERIASKKARVVLTSGGLEPVVDDGGKGQHSVFASAFIEVLNENNGVLDGATLFSKIRRPVMVNSDQTPEYSDIRKAGHDGGDFLFVRMK